MSDATQGVTVPLEPTGDHPDHASHDHVRPPDTGEHAGTLLRYWRAVLKHEAASRMGFPVEPVEEPDAPFSPDLAQPTATGRAYVEFSLADEGFSELPDVLCHERTTLRLAPLNQSYTSIFERWLRARYREEALGARAGLGSEDAGRLALGFPVASFRRQGRVHVAPLLQVPVIPTWLDRDGHPWRAPTRPEGRRGATQEPPSGLSLDLIDTASFGQPYMLNDTVLQRVLGFESERITELLAWLDACDEPTPLQMLTGLAAFMGGHEPTSMEGLNDSPVGALNVLARAFERALKGRPGARVQPCVLLGEATWGDPTQQLQREIGEIIRRGEVSMTQPLLGYLRPAPLPPPRVFAGLMGGWGARGRGPPWPATSRCPRGMPPSAMPATSPPARVTRRT